MAMVTSTRSKLVSGAVTVGIQAGLLGLLLYGLAVDRTARPKDDLQLVDVATPPPPEKKEPVPPPREHLHKAKEKAAPPNLKAQPTEIAPPPPVIRMPVPPTVVTAPVAANGAAARAGAAPFAGPGTGAGGNGNGRGGGGDGAGGGDPPEQIRGEISDEDYPRDLWFAGVQGAVIVRYRVAANGRVDGCRIERSSGNTTLDGLTCSLIEKRFRYRPATDEQGKAVDSTIVHETHEWVIDDSERQAVLARRR